MKSDLELRRCPVKECGAMVYIVPLEEGPVAVDPHKVDVVVREGESGFRRVSGFRMHGDTCVDMTARPARVQW